MPCVKSLEYRGMRLLDINVLIARVDTAHTHHQRAISWFNETASSGWVTCPLTENGFVRTLGHPSYPDGPGSPERAANLLRKLIVKAHGHRSIPDDVSLLDVATFPSLAGIGSKQITDLYLLALAVNHNIRFLSFDERINPELIPGGENFWEIL